MKRFALAFVLFIAFNAVYAQNLDKTAYKEISIPDYQKAGEVTEKENTERFKLDLIFVLQAANSVAFKDAEGALQRFTSNAKLNLTRDQAATVYIRSTHALEGGWTDETIDLAEPKS
ncbi:hypothetical protein TREPR_2519 [Treponema primitia ZAS-2]|uniref:Uncharacterized protein n=1 Tax=Treponema primitia (strain ATCC BAA-887 / DSM 12427 / ZAS-2) TaxID=545694 RepID=F5YGY7_TREPZ|nr:hypothetical protein [Treponema primitia]AEF85521.1 hypothetical protein TREPR_2519 [Treponema primitia ZAS-2]